MRIKSYFASSVQSAISLARKDFGDEVTLVTSHAAALESRHLGDYEVVFAVDEPVALEPSKPAQVIKAAVTVAPEAEPEPVAFQAMLQQVIAEPLSTEENLPEKLDRVRSLLVEMGIDAAMLRALMTMIERSVGLSLPSPVSEAADAVAEAVAAPEPEVIEPEPAMPAAPDLTPAELAFYLSVSVGS